MLVQLTHVWQAAQAKQAPILPLPPSSSEALVYSCPAAFGLPETRSKIKADYLQELLHTKEMAVLTRHVAMPRLCPVQRGPAARG